MAAKEILGKHLPAVTILVIAAVIAWAAIIALRNMPPFTIAMATGPEGSAYYQYGQRYREGLAKAGVDVRLVTTAGSPENLALLQDPRSGVNVGLIRGGTAGASASRELESLGAVSYQPLWLFHRRELLLADGFVGLRGRKISIGPVDSGTQTLSLELLKRNGIDERVSELLNLAPEAAGEKLMAGEIDVMLTLNSWESPIVQMLLADDRIEGCGPSFGSRYLRKATMSMFRPIWGALVLACTAMTMASIPASAQQQGQKPNILFIMGDDIGWMQPSIYHQGLMVGETPNIDRIGQEGAKFMDYVAMQSCTSGRNAFFTAMQEHADSRHSRGARRCGSQDHDLPDAAAQCVVVQVL